MKNEILTTCYQLVAAAVNGTYQGILLTGLVVASLRMLRRTNAATRYAVWFGTLLLLALIIPAHCLRSRWDASDRPAPVETPVSAPALQPDPDAMGIEASSLPPDFHDESDYLAADSHASGNNGAFDADYVRGQQSSDFATSAGTHRQSSEDPARAMVLALIEATASNQVDPTPEPGFLAPIKEKLRGLAERMVTPLPSWKIAPKTPFFIAALLPIIWLAIAGAKVSLLGWQLFRIRRLKLNSAEPTPELNALFLSLREKVGVRRHASLRVSTDCKSPVVLGFFKPAILLPADAGLEMSEHILRHELAHVGRRDDWANLIQHSIKAVFFFHPAIWWVSKRISLEREIACDDQVLQSDLRPKAYALLLADLAGRMQPSVLAPGVSTNHSQLKQRIDMILNSNRNTSPRLAKVRLGLLATAAAFLGAAAIYLAPRLAFAQSTEVAAPAAGLPTDAPSPTVASAGPSAELAVSQDITPPASSDAPSALPAAPSVAPGPKFKPGGAISVNVQPSISPQPSIAILTAPSPDVAPVASISGVVPALPVAPLVASAGPYAEPGQPVPPRPAHRPGRDSSLEDRLDRLEKMVESLVARKGNPGQFDFSPKPAPGEMKFNWKSSPEIEKQWEQKQGDFAKKQAELELKRADMDKHLAELEKLKNLNDPKVSGRFKELAEQHAKMAADQAKVAEQAAREAQRAARDAQRGRTMHRPRDGSHQELEALHKQHEILEKQMEKLDRQIEKLEREQEQLEEQRESDEQNQDAQQNQNDSRNDQHSELSNNNVPSAPSAAK